jgi:hypothetical protein
MRHVLAVAALSVVAGFSAHADLMPSFAGVPTGWSTDRYAPNSFSDVGTFQGRSDVLGIGISSAQSLNNRPAPYQSTFYNTQGEGYNVSGGAGSSISADLYVPGSWSDPANGDVRTDMWGVMTDASSNVTDYPIIGFTNEPTVGSPFVGFRVWDASLTTTACTADNNCWIDLTTPVSYNAWTTLTITFAGGDIDYSIDGTQVYSYIEDPTTTGFSRVLMQAYNFGDPSIAGANPVDYTADWSNTAPVPEPASVLSLATMVLALGSGLRRKFRRV